MDSFLFVAQAASSAEPVRGPLAVLLGVTVFLFGIACVVQLAAYWKVFRKIGQPGWKSLIPVYESWIRFRHSGRPGWWALPALVPVVGLVLSIIAMQEFCRRFNKSRNFAILAACAPVVGYAVLGFGDAVYHDPRQPRPKKFVAKWKHHPHLP